MTKIRGIVWGEMDMVQKDCHYEEVLVPKVRKSEGTVNLLLSKMITILLPKYYARIDKELFFGGPKLTKILLWPLGHAQQRLLPDLLKFCISVLCYFFIYILSFVDLYKKLNAGKWIIMWESKIIILSNGQVNFQNNS